MKVLYSKKFNLVFYHIPKNGMSSMIDAFNFKWTKRKLSKKTNIIAILRCPNERFISSFYEYIHKNEVQNKIYITRKIKIENKKKMRNSIFLFLKFFYFVKEIIEHGFFDKHQYPQINFINSKNKKFVPRCRSIKKVTQFILFDYLEEDVFKNYNLRIKKKNSKRINPINQFLIRFIMFIFRKEIYKKYKKDFEIYNYYKKIRENYLL